jgi:hypothetical protein
MVFGAINQQYVGFSPVHILPIEPFYQLRNVQAHYLRIGVNLGST